MKGGIAPLLWIPLALLGASLLSQGTKKGRGEKMKTLLLGFGKRKIRYPKKSEAAKRAAQRSEWIQFVKANKKPGSLRYQLKELSAAFRAQRETGKRKGGRKK